MGFSILKEFPTRFLSGEEVLGVAVDLVIKEVKKEMAYSPTTKKKEPVIVVYFEGKERGVRLGKERATELKEVTGSDNTDNWIGKKVCMFTQKKEAFKKVLSVIHFRASSPSKTDLSAELDAIALAESSSDAQCSPAAIY